MMVTPLPQGRKAPASPVKHSSTATTKPQPLKLMQKSDQIEFPSGAKSPIKKHLKNAAMAKWSSSTNPTPAARAQVLHKQSPTPVVTVNSSGAKMATLRASIIQVMLGLLDQEQPTVEGTIPILQALAALPLDNPSVRCECLQMLKKLDEASFSPSKPQQPSQSQQLRGHDPRFDAASDIPTSEGDGEDEDAMPPSFVYEYDDTTPPQSQKSPFSASFSADKRAIGSRSRGAKKDSGRAKSLSLHHCKEFLLACANEIHELEDENPNFDYAEETSCETTATHRRKSSKSSRMTTVMQMLASSRNRAMTTKFDYASTAASSASVRTEIGLGFAHCDDDVEADQGSEFSEVLRRADYLSDFDDHDDFEAPSLRQQRQQALRELVSVRGRVLCRQAIRQLQAPPASSSPGELLKLKLRVFNVLKRNGLQSRRNASRKRLAFQNLKTHLQQMRLKRSTMKKLSTATNWLKSSSSRDSAAKRMAAGASVLTTTTAAMQPLDRSTRVKLLLSQHLDLLFIVLCAVFLQSMLS